MTVTASQYRRGTIQWKREQLVKDGLLKESYGTDLPIGRQQWTGYRKQFDCWSNWYRPTNCQWCGGGLDTFDHEHVWDEMRKVRRENGLGHIAYLNIPDWFPSTVCSECAETLTPFVQAFCDIALLNNYLSAFERILSHARTERHRGVEVNWSAPVPISECSASRLARITRHREGDDAAQAFEEHQ